MNAVGWLQQQEAVIQAWMTGHQTGIQTGVAQNGVGLKTWVPSHPIESLIVGLALIMLLRLLPGPRRPE
jgi:hypothetical protein